MCRNTYLFLKSGLTLTLIYRMRGWDNPYAQRPRRYIVLPQYGEQMIWKLFCSVMSKLVGPPAVPEPKNGDHWSVIPYPFCPRPGSGPKNCNQWCSLKFRSGAHGALLETVVPVYFSTSEAHLSAICLGICLIFIIIRHLSLWPPACLV